MWGAFTRRSAERVFAKLRWKKGLVTCEIRIRAPVECSDPEAGDGLLFVYMANLLGSIRSGRPSGHDWISARHALPRLSGWSTTQQMRSRLSLEALTGEWSFAVAGNRWSPDAEGKNTPDADRGVSVHWQWIRGNLWSELFLLAWVPF